MKKLIRILLFFTLGVSSYALNIEQAVDLAIKNNLELEQQKYLYEQSRENVNLNRSGFLPKVNLGYEYNNRDEGIGEQLDKESMASAVVSYNLFNGFSDFNTLNSAKFLEKSSKFLLRAKREDIIFSTKNAYILLLNNTKSFLTYEDAYKLFDKQYLDAKIKFEQGLLAKNDLLQVHVNLLGAQQNVINAKKDLKIAKLNLSNILGGTDLSNENIEDLKQIDFEDKKYDKKALEKRSEIQALKMNIESYKSLEKAQKGSFLPVIDASYSARKYGDDSGLSSREDYPGHQETATVTASWNLYNGGVNYSQIKIYLAQKKELLSKLQRTSLDINLQYESAILELDVAKQNFKTSKLGLEQARENYNIVNNRFNEGISSTTDLVDANYLLTKAKQRYFNSYYNTFLSIAALNRIFETNE